MAKDQNEWVIVKGILSNLFGFPQDLINLFDDKQDGVEKRALNFFIKEMADTSRMKCLSGIDDKVCLVAAYSFGGLETLDSRV